MRRIQILTLVFACAVWAQQPEPDAPGCADSRALPKFPKCRIDNCEHKENDRREFPVREDEQGNPVSLGIDGESRAVMYECSESVSPALLIQYAATGLRGGGYQVLYSFAEKEGVASARKGEEWVLVEAVAKYYTVIELKANVPDADTPPDADAMAETIKRTGHVVLDGIHFTPGKADLLPESVAALKEVVALFNEHPDWRLRVESHTDSIGGKAANLSLSQRRASAVVAWLSSSGGRRAQMEASGLGDSRPVADNATEAGRSRNQRIELVKMAP